MTHTGIATLVSPKDSKGIYELHLHQTPHNAAAAQAGTAQLHASAGNCVSYDTLISFLKEQAKRPAEDRLYFPDGRSVSVRDQAQGVANYFNEHPASAKLAKEFMSNASCSDIAQLTQSIIEGKRDLAITQGVTQTSEGIQHGLASPLGHQIINGLSYLNSLLESSWSPNTDRQGTAPPVSHPSSGGYAKNSIVTAGYMIGAALILALAANGGRDVYQRAKKLDITNRLRKLLKSDQSQSS